MGRTLRYCFVNTPSRPLIWLCYDYVLCGSLTWPFAHHVVLLGWSCLQFVCVWAEVLGSSCVIDRHAWPLPCAALRYILFPGTFLVCMNLTCVLSWREKSSLPHQYVNTANHRFYACMCARIFVYMLSVSSWYCSIRSLCLSVWSKKVICWAWIFIQILFSWSYQLSI